MCEKDIHSDNRVTAEFEDKKGNISKTSNRKYRNRNFMLTEYHVTPKYERVYSGYDLPSTCWVDTLVVGSIDSIASTLFAYPLPEENRIMCQYLSVFMS